MRYKYWKEWTLSCAFGELAGIAAACMIAFGAFTIVGEPDKPGNKVLIMIVTLVGGALQGALVAYFQWRVLVRKFEAIASMKWLDFTMLASVIGWLSVMLISLFLVDTGQEDNGNIWIIDWGSPLVNALSTIAMGVSIGVLFGVFQWLRLRPHALRAGRWILGNVLAWAVGLCWVYLFATLPSDQSGLLFYLTVALVGGILASLSIGLITGYFFVRIERRH